MIDKQCSVLGGVFYTLRDWSAWLSVSVMQYLAFAQMFEGHIGTAAAYQALVLLCVAAEASNYVMGDRK